MSVTHVVIGKHIGIFTKKEDSKSKANRGSCTQKIIIDDAHKGFYSERVAKTNYDKYTVKSISLLIDIKACARLVIFVHDVCGGRLNTSKRRPSKPAKCNNLFIHQQLLLVIH